MALLDTLNVGDAAYNLGGALPTDSLTVVGGSNAAIAIFGDVELHVISLEPVEKRSGVDYARHALVMRKPSIEAVADQLDEMTLTVHLHGLFCNPDQVVQALHDLRDAKVAQDFVWGSGKVEGSFVLTNITDLTPVSFSDGTALEKILTLQLLEYVGPGPMPTGAAIKQPGTPLGALTAPLISSNLGTVPSSIQAVVPSSDESSLTKQTVSLYCNANAGFSVVNSAMDIVNGLKNNTAAVTGKLPGLLGALNHLGPVLSTLANTSNRLTSLNPQASTIFNATQQTQSLLSGATSLIKGLGSSSNMSSDITKVSNSIGSAMSSFNSVSGQVSVWAQTSALRQI